MPIQFPARLIAFPISESRMSSSSELTHGELLTGKVMRVSPDGMARIRFGETDAQARGGGLFRAGQQVLAHVQKTSDKTLLSLLPGVKDGEILDGVAIRPAGQNVLARFGESELLVRVAGSKASALAAGTPIQAQLQIARGGPILQMLPSAASQASFCSD